MIGAAAVLSGAVCGVVRVIAGLSLTVILLRMKGLQKKRIAACAAGAAGIVISFTMFLSRVGLPAFFCTALEAVWIAVCAGHVPGAGRRMCLFVSVFYEIAVAFWQFLFAAGMGILFRSPDFLNSATFGGQAAVGLFHLLLAVLTIVLLAVRDMVAGSAYRMVSAVVLAGFLAVVTLSEQTVLEIPSGTLEQWTVLAVVLMMSVLVFHINRQYEVERRLAALKSEQAALLERDYTALSSVYEVNAKLFHDFHNHVGALRQLLLREKYQEAVQYLDALQAPVRGLEDTVWTGDETLDYLINSKACAAKAEGIDFQIQVEFPRHTNLKSADLCAILGNLLDNALEAARQVPEGAPRFVRLTVRRIHQMLVIKVVNACSTKPVQENGVLKTTKAESGLHGWGLKSAQTAADKYDGMVRTTCADGVFEAVATLSYQGILVR